MSHILQNLIIALNDGSSYALIALGYTMVYGVLRLINFAHGDVFMIGAFVGAYVARFILGVGVHGADVPGFNEHRVVLGVVVAGALVGVAYFLIESGIRRVGSLSIPRLRVQLQVKVPRAASISIAGGICALGLLLIYGPLKGWCASWEPPEAAPSQGLYEAFIGLLAAMAVCGLMGFAIERFAYRPLRKSPKLSALITAIGVSLLIEYLAQIKWTVGGSSFFGPDPQGYAPIVGSGMSIAFFQDKLGVSVVAKDLIIPCTTLVVLAVLWFVVKHTRMGKAMRAVSQNYDSARLMGINIDRVISFTFVFGSMLAAIGGCLWGLTRGQCTPLMGLIPGLKAFVAAVIGGIGNLPGAAVGAIILGLMETFISSVHVNNEAVLSPYKDAIAFLILILVLLLKPEGIFGKSVPEKV